MSRPAQREQHTIAFLRMAAVQMIKLADRAPEIAVELQHMAEQLEAEANDLARPSTE